MDLKELAAELEAVQGLVATAANPHLLDSLKEQAAAGAATRLAALRARLEAEGIPVAQLAALARTGAPSSSGTLRPRGSASRS